MKEKKLDDLKKEQKNIIKELCQTQNVPIYRGSLDRSDKGEANDEALMISCLKFVPFGIISKYVSSLKAAFF